MNNITLDCYENILKYLNDENKHKLAKVSKIFQYYNYQLNIPIYYSYFLHYKYQYIKFLNCEKCNILDFSFLK
ncbi:ORF MSV013 leucine rich repeat gene family protein, similar to Amsacta moorei entomopoxvirus Q3 ORF SW:P28854 [Melanoplus sanguinipes entomopoxvirus]|uniref:ORF MSV013 leucine rich repeat gene family protein, similar to Amsacta moorei entomopoxvirus Q3 ORF SW:P28854 n=1 Tax=Melanoplus sanguinipes entomopoxvirus TaxID=83191 RepID=Q9YW79_MSEPV|nr:ORF MSV013 leucine rich repeat gene family protein, similar to Amsacta moorei entomopoxvirus Q3 ORF SW:P28854 [Melanoplus sanguinipes entomopoxvirus]AAC97856.1 ORF MSV013 leucine rich repeat gene family protein, similar to Amsacta moorei entomopoxvirus Q3 ORF SW:P28854 [Melanoplus sanguinipes entomopoxvirus 'O']